MSTVFTYLEIAKVVYLSNQAYNVFKARGEDIGSKLFDLEFIQIEIRVSFILRGIVACSV